MNVIRPITLPATAPGANNEAVDAKTVEEATMGTATATLATAAATAAAPTAGTATRGRETRDSRDCGPGRDCTVRPRIDICN